MRMLKNKQGWLRILEAVIAVLLVLSFVLLIFSRQNASSNQEEETQRMLRYTLDYLSKDEAVRNSVLANDTNLIDLKIRQILPIGINFSSRICSSEEICSNPAGFLQKTVYSDEILVFANLTYYSGNATKLKIFLWENS